MRRYSPNIKSFDSKRRGGPRGHCVELSPIYNTLKKEKHNGETLENGDIRIGNDMAMDIKTHLVYKLW